MPDLTLRELLETGQGSFRIRSEGPYRPRGPKRYPIKLTQRLSENKKMGLACSETSKVFWYLERESILDEPNVTLFSKYIITSFVEQHILTRIKVSVRNEIFYN